MSTHLTPSDRTFMRHFAILIAGLAAAAVLFTIIGTLVWASLPKDNSLGEADAAGDRIAPVGAVYAGDAGRATLAAASPGGPAPAAAAPAAASGPYSYDAAEGKSLFDGTCAACHQPTGAGIPGTFPPLKGNAVVNDADPATQIETILHGRQGSVIGGVKYATPMPPFGGQFSDLQVADIANYERSSWGNHGKHIVPADVAKVRAGGK